jgi:cyanophycin synthetase
MTELSAVSPLSNRIVAGFLPGWQQPLAIIEADIPADLDIAARLSSLHGALRATVRGLVVPAPPAAATPEQLGRYLLVCLQTLLVHAHFLQLAPPRLEYAAVQGGTRLRLLIPTYSPFHTAINAAVEVLLRLLVNANDDAQRQQLTRVVQALEIQRPQPGITARLLQAAVANGIPWLYTAQNVFQFGWGRAARLFDAGFTERTSLIGVRMTHFKYVAAQVLRQAGLPVPMHEAVSSAQHAEATAARLGYPVVVKPADLDNGSVVELTTPVAVTAAYQHMRKLTDKVLVEQHIAGRHYRLIVLRGKVVSVIERMAACIVGDGKQDVRALLARFNSEPDRQPQAQRWKQVNFDAEVLALLAEQLLQPDSIPQAARVVRLRRAVNIQSGGTIVALKLNQVHADNLLLCERAAAALRLDLAGIDLVSADIGDSWHDNGAAVCDVSAQPVLPGDLPALLLQQMIHGQGRIPVIAIIADPPKRTTPWWHSVESALNKAGIVTGVANGDCVRVKGAKILKPDSLAHAATLLLREPTLATALLVITGIDQLRDGAPVDKLDLLVLATTTPNVTLLQTLLPRSDALWCVTGSKLALKRAGLNDNKARTVAAARLAPALQAFVEARL